MERTERELRASGITIQATSEPHSELIPQHRQIIMLAARGLTSRFSDSF